MTPAECRAGRALLGWSQRDLAQRAHVAVSTVADFERTARTPVANNAVAIQVALEEGGVSLVAGGAVMADTKPPLRREPPAQEPSPAPWGTQ